MGTVALLLECLSGCEGAFSVDQGRYRLEAAAGRPGSVCFTVQEIVGHGGQITLGEGFSLDGRLIFEQHTLPEAQVERIIQEILTPERELVCLN